MTNIFFLIFRSDKLPEQCGRDIAQGAIRMVLRRVVQRRQHSFLRHPTKPCLCAVVTYEVLPDADV